MNESPYWLVWAEDGDAPRVKHRSQMAAEKEAERLANLHPGSSFCVLAPTARFTVRRVTIERFAPDLDVPF